MFLLLHYYTLYSFWDLIFWSWVFSCYFYIFYILSIISADWLPYNQRALITFLFDKTDPSNSTCSWYGTMHPTLLQRMWICSKICIFWDQILNYIHTILMILIEKASMTCLFENANHSTSSGSSCPTTLLPWISLYPLSARRAMLKSWTSSNAPKVSMVKKELKSLMYIEKLDTITQAFNSTKRFFNDLWNIHCQTPKYPSWCHPFFILNGKLKQTCVTLWAD